MNCMEFRRITLSGPADHDDDYLSHKRDCRSCAIFYEEIQKFDKKLNEASRIQTPEELEYRILLQQSLQREKPLKRLRSIPFALAATLLLAIGLVIGLQENDPDMNLDEAVIHYIATDQNIDRSTRLMQPSETDPLLREFGMAFKGNVNPVNYVERCKIRNKESLLIKIDGSVINSDLDTVILLYMPADPVDMPIAIQAAHFKGVITPCPRGSVAIIGREGEDLREIEEKIRNSIQWI